MASSSIHFKKATSHSSAHNTRADIPKYLLPEKHRLENEYWQNEKSARQLFDDELQKATRKGGPKPKFENSHWEAVLNLNAEHSLTDVQKVAKLIEKKFNITCTSIAVHRDEGHVKEGQPIYNYHAHLEFMTYQNGQQNWRREHVKNGLSELQTIVANELNMIRGKEGSEAERLDHKQYRVIAREQEAKEKEIHTLKQELEREKLSKEQIKEEFEKFRKENANKGFTSAFFRELGEEKKRQLKEPSMNRKEIREFVESLKESHRGFLGVNKDAVIEELKEKLHKQAIENASLKAIALEAISSVDSEKKRLAEEAERLAEKQNKEYREIVSNEKKRWEKKMEELTLQSVLNEVVLMRDEAIKILEKSLKSIEEKYNQVKESFSQLLSEKLKLEAENETLNKKVKILTEQLETAQKSLETKKTTQSIAPSQKRPEIDARAKAALVKKKQEQDRGFER